MLKTLIVEDDHVSGMVLEELMGPLGSFEVAKDGEEAVAKITQGLDNSEPFDLILLDIHMPKLNGKEALEKIRSIEAGHSSGHRCKIVITTGDMEYDTVMESFEKNCDSYLIKPIDQEKLMNVLKELGLQ